jgi:GNAT superfamily N-acetyltransferase
MTTRPLHFRRADRSDSAAVARLLSAVWPVQPVDSAVLTAALTAAAVVTRLALLDGQPIGLTSCFRTQAADGTPRWELDLLLIDPAQQGRGYSAAVLGDAVAGRPPDCRLTRALVADGQPARTRMYQRAGFMPAEPPLQLWVRSAQIAGTPRTAPLDGPLPQLIPVTTLLYQGAWLENISDPRQVAAAAALQNQRGWPTLGMLLPAATAWQASAIAAHGFAAVGGYRWWQLSS